MVNRGEGLWRECKKEKRKKEKAAGKNGLGRRRRRGPEPKSQVKSGRILKKKGTPSSKHVPCRSHTETPQMPSFHNRLLPSAPFLLTRPNIILNFHKALCLSPPPSPYNPSLLSSFRALSPSSCPQRRVLIPPFNQDIIWPSHASSSLTTLHFLL